MPEALKDQSQYLDNLVGMQLDPETVKRLEEARRIAIDPETVKRLEEARRIAIDPETVKRLEEARRIAIDPETVKRLEEARRIAVDPETVERARSSLAISVRQLRALSAGVALELEQTRAAPVASFADALWDDEQPDMGLASEWLIGLRTTRQRRLLVLSLAALSSVLDAVDAEANVQLPGHLSLVINALIAIAVLLNEAIDQLGQ